MQGIVAGALGIPAAFKVGWGVKLLLSSSPRSLISAIRLTLFEWETGERAFANRMIEGSAAATLSWQPTIFHEVLSFSSPVYSRKYHGFW